MKHLYSIVVPVFNSEGSLRELHTRIKTVFAINKKLCEIIFIDDGSKDKSWEILKEIHKSEENVKIIRFSENFGQHNALFCGIQYAKGDFVITIDDDLQVPPEEINKLIEKQKKTLSELTYGYFHKKKHSLFRNIASRMIKNQSKKHSDKQGEGSSFKLIKKSLSDKIKTHEQQFVYIDELLLWYSTDVDYVKVEHKKRQNSKSGYTITKLLKLYFNLIIYYSAVPLRIMTFSGLILSIVSFMIGIRFLIRKIFYNVPLGFTSLIVTVLFSTSIILFSLGIIGEYLNRIYEVKNKKPRYIVKERFCNKL